MIAFLLDTTVIVDLLRGFAATERWLRRQRLAELSLSTITLGELLQGIHHQLGADRTRLDRALASLREDTLAPFRGRILVFDEASAEIWGRIMGEGSAAGRRPSTDDAKVAAIALRHGLTVVTSNIAHFAGLVAGGAAKVGDWLAGSFCAVEPDCLHVFARATFLVDDRHLLPRVDRPCLILSNSADALVPPAARECLSALIPQATGRTLDIGGHAAHLTHPFLVAEQVRDFLR